MKQKQQTKSATKKMRDEGTVAMGDIPDDNPIFTQVPADDQDKAELRVSGD